MDRLFQRYADPFSFMNGMLWTGRFCEFVEQFVKTTMEEKEEARNWDFFLHRVFEGSYNDFCESMKTAQQNQSMNEREIETTLNESENILNHFNPETDRG